MLYSLKINEKKKEKAHSIWCLHLYKHTLESFSVYLTKNV